MPTSSTIIDKLDLFIRKYYKNKLLKGLILTIALMLILFIAMVVLEHFGYFGTTVRTIFFWFFIVALLSVISIYIAAPLSKMFRLGKRISYDEAARIIGNHFPEVSDKLLNLLQLKEMSSSADNELLKASIDQKTSLLSPIPFLNAINLKGNLRYVKYAAIPLFFILICLIIAPSFITEPSKRIINHSTYYERPAPFSFILENDSLKASQKDDFMVRLSVEGNEIPNDVSIIIDDIKYQMQKGDNTHFSYLFKNLQRSHTLQFSAAGITSRPYQLDVLPRPAISNFQALLSYPAYTGRESETLVGEGDITVPKGTRIEWIFTARDADTLRFIADSVPSSIPFANNGRARFQRRAMGSFSYSFLALGSRSKSDTLSYSVSVIDDAHPMIVVMQMTDSTMPDRHFFRGQIKDDYGFSRLEFVIERSNAKDTSSSTERQPIAITSDPSQEFNYSTDFSNIQLNPGDRVKYYFEIWDNDAINGSKSSKSQTFEIQIPTEEEIDQILRNSSSDISQSAETSISDLKKLQEEINDLMRRLVDKKELSWQDKKQLDELKKKHEEVKEHLEQMRQQMQENQRLEDKYRDQSEQIYEKQKELDKLFDQVMSDEIKEMMKEMDRLMNEVDKQKVQEQLENMKIKNEDLEKQLDQNIELMKRLDLEKRVEQAVQKADELAKQQDELSQKKQDSKDALEQQKKLSDQYQQLQKDIDQIKKDYKSLDNPSDFKTDEQLQQHIQQSQQEAEQKLQKGKQKDASKSQKQAADDLKKLSEQLAESQMDLEQQDLAEDSEQIRQLLKNLVHLSFNQESLINSLNEVSTQDPKYQQIIRDQNLMKDDFRSVDDSLRALAKRQIAVASAVGKELASVNSNISKSLSLLLQYNQSIYGNFRNLTATKNMQYSMTSLNNLALLLAESLDQLQNQMRQNQQQRKQNSSCKRQGMKMKSNQSCSNPGSKPSPKSMRQMQDELNKQMEALKKELDKQGKNKSNRTQIGKHNTMSSEFAKMAAQQEQIRRMMQEYGQEMKELSGGNSKLSREIDEMMRQMEQTETDLVNRTITRQTIQRQQQIMTRLLQHEKAELQQEKDDRRQSTEAKDVYQPSQGDLEQYNRLKQKNTELFHTTPPSLNPYYRDKVNSYFFKL